MDPTQEALLCFAIETGLSAEYQRQPNLTDALCILGLDNAIIAMKKQFGFAKNESVLCHSAIDGIVAHVVSVGPKNDGNGGVSLKDYIAVINKIRRSALTHSTFGPQAYGVFVQEFVAQNGS